MESMEVNHMDITGEGGWGTSAFSFGSQLKARQTGHLGRLDLAHESEASLTPCQFPSFPARA